MVIWTPLIKICRYSRSELCLLYIFLKNWKWIYCYIYKHHISYICKYYVYSMYHVYMYIKFSFIKNIDTVASVNYAFQPPFCDKMCLKQFVQRPFWFVFNLFVHFLLFRILSTLTLTFSTQSTQCLKASLMFYRWAAPKKRGASAINSAQSDTHHSAHWRISMESLKRSRTEVFHFSLWILSRHFSKLFD